MSELRASSAISEGSAGGQSRPLASDEAGWTILVVEPDGCRRDAVQCALADLVFAGAPMCLRFAASKADALGLLDHDNDIALVVIDAAVLAEGEPPGIIHHIREIRANALTRIVVRAGRCLEQFAHEVAATCDINACVVEGPDDGTAALRAAAIMALRSYKQLRDLQTAQATADEARRPVEVQLAGRRDELMQASFRLRAVLGAAPLPIVITTLDETRITFANQRTADLWGTSPDRVVGQDLIGIFEQEAHRRAFVERIGANGTVDGLEVAIAPAGGQKRWTLISAVVISFGDQPLLLATIVDITELKSMESALLEAKNAAEQANIAKSHFLATMSHELRTPLNAILGFSEIIREQQLGPTAVQKYAEYAGDIYESGSLLLDLINDILDIAKIEAGALEVELAHVDLSAVLAGAARLVLVRADRAGLMLTTRIPPNLPPVVADPRAIKQVLFNLLTNAIKFTPKGGSVVLSAEMLSDQTIALRVTDTGCGIPADQLERVMQPFQQLDNRYARSEGGSGLGLALVKALTSLHAGDVRIESEVGKGTTVTITLPLAPPLLLDQDPGAA
ncbi:MAG: PAS domain S-box protein [Rhodospirillaceae bacterium]|nr:PAS domain S-box protein [Rhodospirillaceae bacterium]